MNLRISQRNQELSLKTQELALKSQEQTLETRQAQLFMQSFNIWLTQGFIEKSLELANQEWRDFEEWSNKYGFKNNPNAAIKYFTVDTFFEGLGVLVKRKLVDPWLVDEFMSADIIAYWNKMRPVAEGIRRQGGWELWAENSEYLYDEVYKVYKQQHPDLNASTQ